MDRIKKYVICLGIGLCLFFGGCKNKVIQETEVKTLTLAVFESESQLHKSDLFKWIKVYNEKHPEVHIEIVNYANQYSELKEALNQIKIEINAGKGPDMINFGKQYSPLDASCGMLMNLYSFIESEPSFVKEDFNYNVLQALGIGDALYVLVPNYCIDSFATVDDTLADLQQMNVKQLVKAYQLLEEESILFPGETKNAVFGMLCYGSLENYVDWAEGICSFNGDSFKEILSFANSFPLYLNITEEYSAKQIFTEGKALLYPVNIDNVYEITGVRMLYGETPTYIGYPLDSGYGSMVGIEDIAIGISSTSKNSEEAWEFLKSLLDSEFQDNVESGLPVRISSLGKMLEEAMKPEYNAEGEMVIKESLRFEGEETVCIYEISKEDANILIDIISKMEYNNTIDYHLYNILLEEAEYLFHEERSVDAVAEIIQNRASIYISENR